MKGYISRKIPNPFSPNQPSYELSFEVAKGMSGSPLLTFHNGTKVLGVLYGNGRTEYIDDYYEEQIEQDKKREIINKRILSCGLAHITLTLKELLDQ